MIRYRPTEPLYSSRATHSVVPLKIGTKYGLTHHAVTCQGIGNNFRSGQRARGRIARTGFKQCEPAVKPTKYSAR